MRHVGAILLVLLVIYLVPFVVYGGASALAGLPAPEGASPRSFLLGVLVTKLGTAVAFVLLFSIGAWNGRWPLYAALWLAMFASSEAGDYLAGRSTAVESALGVLAELLYTPLAAFAVHGLLRR